MKITISGNTTYGKDWRHRWDNDNTKHRPRSLLSVPVLYRPVVGGWGNPLQIAAPVAACGRFLRPRWLLWLAPRDLAGGCAPPPVGDCEWTADSSLGCRRRRHASWCLAPAT